ncbi:MAG TPA: DUF2497 domain-containing protein [Roseiarcus sp.]|nr:DUF2497 domain-containing protein [Roseiarcus sp.]
MSAVNSSAGDREVEAIRRAQRAHEPSMEEILASIRGIIAEERDPVRAAGYTALRPAAPAFASQVVHSENSQAERAARQAPWFDLALSKANTPTAAPSQPPEAEPAGSAEDDEPLTSPETEEAVLAAFATLSAGLRARSAELAEAMVRELIRPMLKAWLDENLPGVVERLVRAELDRISRSLR